MVRQCSKCHLYVNGAPHPDLAHHDVPAGQDCNLLHHPQPCPWVDDRTGQSCQHYAALPPPLLPPTTLSTSVTSSGSLTTPATITETQAGGATSIPEQLAQLMREKEAVEREAELLKMANNNLRESHQRLNQEMMQLSSSSVPSSISSTTTTVTSSFSSLSSRPLMGTGFSAGFGVTVTSPSVSASGLPSSLAGAAQTLSQLNAPPVSVPHTIPGYGGPLIPELRGIPEVNQFTQQVLNNIYQQIPALAPQKSAPTTLPYPVPSYQQQAPPYAVAPPLQSEMLPYPAAPLYPVQQGVAPAPGPVPPPQQQVPVQAEGLHQQYPAVSQAAS